MASVVTKTDGFSGEACQKENNNRCSFNSADLSSPRVKGACNGSDTRHPLRACLSRESFSENAESEETLRDCNTSEGIKMIVKASLHQTCANNCGSIKATIFHDKAVSNQLENQEESECLGDNISFISGSDYTRTRPNADNIGADKKNTSYNSASVDSFSESEKTVNGQPASCCLVGSPCGEVDDNHPMRSNRSSNESSQEIVCCSNKSDISEISCLGDSCAGATTAKVEHSESSVEQFQSSFARENALQCSQIGEGHDSAMQVDTGINERERTAEVKSTTVVKEVKKEDNVGSRLAACSDGSDCSEYEVKVCDICGDIGREELLAVCSECNDGAEHIYCMRVKMDNVPKGDWMCEECMLSEENEKQKQDKLEEDVRILKESYSSESTKGLEVERSKPHKVGSTPLYSSKIPSDGLQAVRKRSNSKTPMHQYGGPSSSSTIKTMCIPNKSSCKSPKLSSQSLVSKGFNFKSKSFSAMSLKEYVQQLKEGSFCNEGFAKETAASEPKGRVQLMSRSASLKNMRSYSVNNSNHDSRLLSNFSEDLKRSRHPKEQYSTKTQKKPRLAESDLLASIADKRTASPGKSSLPHPSSSFCHDLMAMKGQEISDNSLKSGHSSQGGSPNEEPKRVINIRQHVEYQREVVPATTTEHSNANVHSDERPYLGDSSMFDSEVYMPSWMSAVLQLDNIWQGKFEIQRSWGLPCTCDRMQAHLSTYASSKVHEVVHKLPQKLLLEEVPRLSMWPTQFMKSHPTEDDITLYFFAKDADSYERSYKNLLDRMIKNDLSLKQNFGEVELLIFSSNLLPEKSQRWNKLQFLWGVFRGKRVHCSGHPAVSASENLRPLGTSVVSPDTPKTLNSNTLLASEAVSSGKMVEACETKASSWEQEHLDLQTSSSQLVSRVDSSQREESESKRRHEFDLNYSLEDNQDYAVDYTEADGRHDKRLNSCYSVMNIGDNSSKDINHRYTIDTEGKGPSISGELKCNGAYDMSIVSPQLDSKGDMYSWKSLQQQVLSNNGGIQRDSSVPSLDLKLGVERSSSDQGGIPPFSMLMGSKDLQFGNSARETTGDTNPSLALSLALPYPMTGGCVLELDSKLKLPKCPKVNTTLSLFGTSSDS
ncbi:hypothetical protein PTKIN_Ptkin04bG0227700 [Pterospermum kingtungense]